MAIYKLLLSLSFIALFAGCGPNLQLNSSYNCGFYKDPASSDYILPYHSGESYKVSQGNCGSVSHAGGGKYSYDFSMIIGTEIVAARSGTVVAVVQGSSDGVVSASENYVYIEHSDGSQAGYIHLTKNGALVNVGDHVQQGEIIALSGNTGRTTGPHLHFVVWEDLYKKNSIPVTFSNVVENQIEGLEEGKIYGAL